MKTGIPRQEPGRQGNVGATAGEGERETSAPQPACWGTFPNVYTV